MPNVFPRGLSFLSNRYYCVMLDGRTMRSKNVLFLNYFVCRRFELSDDKMVKLCSHFMIAAALIAMHCTFQENVYFGSHCTYPLLTPFTSLTTNSKASKSSAVTASNPTSKMIKDHSKKAYLVYAATAELAIELNDKEGTGISRYLQRPCALCAE